MKKTVTLALRVLMGFFFTIAGLDGFFNILPPFPMSDKAATFTGVLIDPGFLWQLMKATQLVAGVLLLANLYVPLALTLLAPIIAIIFCMVLFINPSGLPIGIVLAVLELALAWFYRDYFKPVLVQKAVIENSAATEQKLRLIEPIR